MENKICKNCCIEKNINEFKNTGKLCRICFNEYMKNRRAGKYIKETIPKKEKEYDNYHINYYINNKDKIIEQVKQWRINNKDKYRNNQRKHQRNLNLKNERSGYIYLITNPAWTEYVKLGRSYDVKKRLISYQTFSPLKDFHISYETYTNNITLIENTFREKFGYDNGEWYKVNILEAINIIETLINNLKKTKLPLIASHFCARTVST